MKLALALVCLGGCAFFLWRIFATSPLDHQAEDEAWPDSENGRNSFMSTNRKLERVATQLDDISETLEEIKDAVMDGDAPSGKKLNGVQKDVQRAADAIEKVVDSH